MSIKNQILADIKIAMKARDQDRLRVLRSLKSKLMEKEISERTGGSGSITDEQAVEVFLKAAKQRRESIEQFEKAGRTDLSKKERVELEVIESYLPEMMGEEEVRKIVKKRIGELGASTMADMGKVMGVLMGEFKGKAEGSVVNKVVKEELST